MKCSFLVNLGGVYLVIDKMLPPAPPLLDPVPDLLPNTRPLPCCITLLCDPFASVDLGLEYIADHGVPL